MTGSGRLFELRRSGEIGDLRLRGIDAFTVHVLLGFGQDADGEVDVMVNSAATPFGDTSEVLWLAPFRVTARAGSRTVAARRPRTT